MTEVSYNVFALDYDGGGDSSSFSTSQDPILIGNVGGYAQEVFFLFRIDDIPQGANIESAYLKLKSRSNNSSTTLNLRLYFEQSDSASYPTTWSDLDSRSVGDPVDWLNLSAWTDETEYTSPDIGAILQPIIDRAFWEPYGNVLLIVKDHESDTDAYRSVAAYEFDGTNKSAKLVINYNTEAGSYSETSADGGKFGDAAEAENKFKPEFFEGVGVGDHIDAYNADERIADAAGIADGTDAYLEKTGGFAEAAGIGDAADALNWTEWVRTYRDSAVARFYCTLTGAADGLADIELPISSFQARKRQGESNYLSVIVPGMAYAEAIAARSNGELYIEMAYLVNGEATIREEIIRVEDLEINIYEGASSRSINLSGYREATYVAKNASISGSNYKYTMSGRRGFRFPQADPYLNPGDTLTVEDTDDELTVDQISYIIAARGLKQMEVRE